MSLQDKLRNYKEEPSKEVWSRIQNDLPEQKKGKVRVIRFPVALFTKIAALFVLVFAALFGMKNMFVDHNANLFASNNNAPIKLEELGVATDPYFSIEQIEGLKKAYSSISK